MKKNIVSILAYSLLGLSTIMVSCGGDSKSGDTHKTETVASEMAFLRADVSGMTCAIGCAKPIEKMLNEIEGVTSAEIDFEKKAAFINYDKAKVSEADLLKAVSEFKDGSYSAKVSDKNCKSECKKACCASKEGKSTATHTGHKTVKSSNSNTSKSAKSNDLKDLKGTEKPKSINVDDKVVKSINDKKANATKAASKTINDIKKTATKNIKTVDPHKLGGDSKTVKKATSKKMPQ